LRSASDIMTAKLPLHMQRRCRRPELRAQEAPQGDGQRHLAHLR
jgi:hypothetical protein